MHSVGANTVTKGRLNVSGTQQGTSHPSPGFSKGSRIVPVFRNSKRNLSYLEEYVLKGMPAMLLGFLLLGTTITVAQTCPDYQGVGFSVRQQNKLCAAAKGAVKGAFFEHRTAPLWTTGSPQYVDIGLPASSTLIVSFVTVHWWSPSKGGKIDVYQQATVPLGDIGGQVVLFTDVNDKTKSCSAIFHVSGAKLEIQYSPTDTCFNGTGGIAMDIGADNFYQ